MPSARTLACPASLKGVLTARQAAAALAQGLSEWSHVDELPVADGGEGTLDVLQPVLGAEWREADVHDAFGRPARRAGSGTTATLISRRRRSSRSIRSDSIRSRPRRVGWAS